VPAANREELHMLFVIIGVVLIAMNLLGIGPPAAWNWQFTGDLWKFLWPFGLALAWWVYADSTGMTQRREMDKMDAKRLDRRRKAMEALGLQNPKRRKRW
jgi:small Trp-rich protein